MRCQICDTNKKVVSTYNSNTGLYDNYCTKCEDVIDEASENDEADSEDDFTSVFKVLNRSDTL